MIVYVKEMKETEEFWIEIVKIVKDKDYPEITTIGYEKKMIAIEEKKKKNEMIDTLGIDEKTIGT